MIKHIAKRVHNKGLFKSGDLFIVDLSQFDEDEVRAGKRAPATWSPWIRHGSVGLCIEQTLVGFNTDLFSVMFYNGKISKLATHYMMSLSEMKEC